MISNKIIDWIKEYSKTNNFKLVVGISGGIDSALVSTLCAKTGIETHVVSMPIHQNLEELNRAKNHIIWLKNNFQNIIQHDYDLTNVFEDFKLKFDDKFHNELGLANSRSRLRMITLYQIAASINGLVVGTGNKVEDFGVGFFTKYGDGGVDISPIGDLTKTQVRNIAKELEINEEILTAKSTDGLWNDSRTDEDQIGASYEELEWAMNECSTNYNKKNNYSKRELEILNIYNHFHSKNFHKMIPIPVCKIN